ncbi:MAG: DUF4339 domain-containing protein [Polyangiaceae bacterium]|nr:DUF4339 domain-containing protein [Polyangiaceae bacterium]
MSSRFGAHQQPASHGRASSRGRFQSGFVPASADTPNAPALEHAGTTWLVNVGESDTVEMTGDEIARAWREGRLDEQTLVWRQGLLEWTALRTVPQLSIALDRRRPVRGGAIEDISEDELTELWAPPDGRAEPPLAPSRSTCLEPERLPEDEVTELWGSGQVSRQSVDAPPPPLSSYDAEQLPEDEVTELWGSAQVRRQSVDAPPPPPSYDAEQLPEDEATHLWDSRPPDLEAIEAASLSLERMDDAPALTVEEIEYEDEQLAEDEVTTLWAEHGAPGLAAMDRGALGVQPARRQYEPTRPPSALSPSSNAASVGPARTVRLRSAPARLIGGPPADRLTQPSMLRIAEMRGRMDDPFVSRQPFERPAGITTIAFWADGVRGLYELLSTRLEWVVDRVIRLAEHRGGAAWPVEGFQSRTAVFLTEVRTVLTDVVLAALERLGQWTARIADRFSGRARRRHW